MANINLLPWRETLRRRKANEFLALILGAILLTLGLLYGWHLFVQSQIEQQNRRNQLLKQEIALVDSRISEIKDLEKTKTQLLARMDIIQQLQASRPEIVHIFDELVSTLPDGVVLTEITQAGKTLTVRGKAQSNARVSAYMRNIEKSEWLTNPTLQIIENKADRPAAEFSNFVLVMQQARPKGDAESAETGGAE